MTTTGNHPVNSATHACCGGIGRNTPECPHQPAAVPDVPLPVGADPVLWEWDGDPPHRAVFGADRGVTDHRVRVYTMAIQLADGRIDDGEPPSVVVCDGQHQAMADLNSDQARELAAALLQTAGEIDGWVAK
ncbi:hypothetical protein [Mycobacterium seoulense]|uniref:hypothetical protein n=1 Tax=Mycobacterium seoulense TaxID=386911 RepID=UPI003CEF87DD